MEETGHPHDPHDLLSHREWIRGLARRLVRDEHAAEDVAQDTMATALSRRPPVLHSLRGWLTTVTRSRAIDRQRSESARSAREQQSRPRSVPSTADLVARADAQRAVAAAVMDLEEPYRTTVLLRHFEELTPTEIGERTGVPRETVKTRLRRAHALLRDKLDAEFGGERERWRAALLPLLGPLVPNGPPSSPARPGVPEAATTAGALAMSNTTKIAAVAAALLLLLAGGAAVSTFVSSDGDVAETGVVDVAPVIEDAPEVEAPAVIDEPRTLTGRVRRRRDGAPVANVSLVLAIRDGTDVRTATASDGTFTLSAPSGSTSTLGVAANGYVSESVALQSGLDDIGTIWIESGSRLVVRVEDEDGAAVPGVDVSPSRWAVAGTRAHVDSFLRGMTGTGAPALETRSAPSGADGLAVFADARAGLWRVTAIGDGVASTRSVFVTVHPDLDEVRATLVVASTTSLSGRVLDVDGRVVANALVSAACGMTARKPLQMRTGTDGRFEFSGLPAGTVSLSVDRALGPGTKLVEVQVPNVSTMDLILPPTGRLVGRVSDEEGRGLAGESVSIEVGGTAVTVTRTLTGSDGRYAFEAVPVGRIGRFRIFAEDRVQLWPRIERGELVEPAKGDGGAPSRRVGTIVAGGTTTVDAVMTRGGVITGSVVGPDGPVAGVQVWRWRKPSRTGQNWASTTTNDDGTYRFPPDLPGPVALQIRHPSLYRPGLPTNVSSALSKGMIEDEFIVEIPARGEISAELHVVAGAAVPGRVEDQFGAPVPNAWVVVDSSYGQAQGGAVRSDADGHFTLPSVSPEKSRRIHARIADGEGRTTVDITPEGPARPVVLVVTRESEDPVATEGRDVSGRVVLATSGAPVEGVRILLVERKPIIVKGRRSRDRWRNEPVVAVSDGNGEFQCHIAGSETRWLAAEGGATVEEIVEVGPDTRSAEFRLRRSFSVSGRVHDTDGAPLVGATVIAVSAYRSEQAGIMAFGSPQAAPVDGRPGAARTRDDGTFTIRGVPEGRCTLNVFRAEALEDYQSAMMAKPTAFGPFDAGAEGLDLRMDQPQRASLRLRVVWADGKPVTVGQIRYIPEGALHGGFVNLRSDDGRVSIPDTADPTYALRVTAYGDASVTRIFRGVAPGETEHELVLAPGLTITGRVVDASGSAVPGIAVHARRVGPFDMLASYTTAADADGYFVLRDVDDATYTLQTGTAPSGWRRSVKAVEASAGDTGVELRTTSEGRVTGLVVDTDGAAVAGMQLTFYRPPVSGVSGPVPHTTTDENGRFEMTGLDPALTWTIEPQLTPHDHTRQRELRQDVTVGQTDVRLVVPAKE